MNWGSVIALGFTMALLAAARLSERFGRIARANLPALTPATPRAVRAIRYVIAPMVPLLAKRLPRRYLEKQRRRLRRAELEGAISPEVWTTTQLLAAVASGCALATLAAVTRQGLGAVAFAIGAVTAWLVLESWLRDAGLRTVMSVRIALPGLLDLLTLAVEAGCSLNDAILLAVEKSREGPLRRAMERTILDVRAGRSRAASLAALGEWFDLPEISALVSALRQSDASGASLGAILRAQSEQRSNERFTRAERLALEAPVKLLVPLVTCIFPCTFIVLVFPVVAKIVYGL
ncbi:MAG: type II secretion system F family protein [Steroidobacteraceae bacterium]